MTSPRSQKGHATVRLAYRVPTTLADEFASLCDSLRGPGQRSEVVRELIERWCRQMAAMDRLRAKALKP